MFYNDASYANLPDGTSSTGARIIFLSGDGGRFCPISWSSTKIKCIVRSTLAVEALSLTEGCESAFVIGCFLTEPIYGKSNQQNKIPIRAFVDNKSLVQNAYSTTMVSENRLRIEMAVVNKMFKENEVSIKWIEATNHKLNVVLSTGKIREKLVKDLKLLMLGYGLHWFTLFYILHLSSLLKRERERSLLTFIFSLYCLD